MTTILDLKAHRDDDVTGAQAGDDRGRAEATGAFATLAPFRDGNIFSAKFSGDGAWERHPNGDELVQMIAGVTTLGTS